ncbi:SDR family oxidoreductase [Algisphaera agarilytica]|uniref:NAD(P)-dependent dehydrogenase (Short-subunit alcohol dehydrogenase family) n=1 Tax=Algisphaera agarilytica TaxID=1385975 RepID=A0A7X0H955_9BACT|nr:SDR family oxidoreductase [Algisphaera agarilytica]MBB6431516.1 NAD(P)-dependent dehydrogenase (short-subunit alcohol dehydrogenase family) [Algisphaera agarilytica]
MTEQAQKVALVTGAGSGVGRDTALLLADAGYAVALVARTESKLQEAAEYIRSEGPEDAELLVLPTDVSDSAAVDQMVQAVLDKFGRIDAIANCAGSAPLQPIAQMTDEIIDAALDVNLKSVLYVTRAAWPAFRKQKQGAICNISSMASIDPFTGFNVYAAAKAGVNLFTKATADEGKRFNVIAAAIAPGAIETPMLRDNFPTNAIPEDKTLDPLVVAGLARDILTGQREITPGETIVLPSP